MNLVRAGDALAVGARVQAAPAAARRRAAHADLRLARQVADADGEQRAVGALERSHARVADARLALSAPSVSVTIQGWRASTVTTIAWRASVLARAWRTRRGALVPTTALKELGTGRSSPRVLEKGALKSENWGCPANCSTLAINIVVRASSRGKTPITAVWSVIFRTEYPLVILLASIAPRALAGASAPRAGGRLSSRACV